MRLLGLVCSMRSALPSMAYAFTPDIGVTSDAWWTEAAGRAVCRSNTPLVF